jgi:cyclohexa-1,5-dienecarbonyl-CoA hydratase
MSALLQDRSAKVSCRPALDGALLWVTLDAPPGNILDGEMIASLRRVVADARSSPRLRLLAFVGAGRHFSYGASVEEHRPGRVQGMLKAFHALIRDLMDADLPMAACVRGRCLGGGLELAAFCDRVVVEAGAMLGQPEIKLGVFAPVGSLVLPWRCGAAGGDLLLTGRTVDADEAAALGLADQACASGEGEERIERWARQHLLPLSPSSLRLARRASRLEIHGRLRDGLAEVERMYLDELMTTRDATEGIEAFLAKRPPVWSGA